MSKEVDFGFLGGKYEIKLINEILDIRKRKDRFGEQIIDILESSYFPNQYLRPIINIIKNHYEHYSKIPSVDTVEESIRAEIHHEITRESTLSFLKQIREVEDQDWELTQKRAINFCKHQEWVKTINKAKDLIDQGKVDEYETIEEMVKETIKKGMPVDDGVDLFEDMDGVLEDDYRVTIRTGIKGIDDHSQGGLGKGEVGIVIAPSGVGKTTILSKFANTAFEEGKNVLVICFEEAPKKLQRKQFAIYTGHEIAALGHMRTKVKEEMTKVLKRHKEQGNSMYFKRFSSFGTTPGKIRSYLNKAKSNGVIYDMVIIDYFDCLSISSKGNKDYFDEAPIMRKLEALAVEFDIALWTATQGGRSSFGAEEVNAAQMGGYIKKIDPATLVISIARTAQQNEDGTATLMIVKNRNGKSDYPMKNIVFDNGRVLIDTDLKANTPEFIEHRRMLEEQRQSLVSVRAEENKQMLDKRTLDDMRYQQHSLAMDRIREEHTLDTKQVEVEPERPVLKTQPVPPPVKKITPAPVAAEPKKPILSLENDGYEEGIIPAAF